MLCSEDRKKQILRLGGLSILLKLLLSAKDPQTRVDTFSLLTALSMQYENGGE
jgi:hypothetical protein